MPDRIVEILERLQREPIIRTFAVDREAVDEENRTIQVAFASDKPIDHWFGQLTLTMSKKSMRADRLKTGAPLLMDHNTRDLVGVVEGHSIGDDGIARATVRFGESTRANEIFRDVQTGIRQCISVGFMVYEMHLEKEEKGKPDLYRCDDWEPYEISLVAVPADISVGVGRDKQAAFQPLEFSQPAERAISTKTENTMTPEEIAAAAAAEEARQAEVQRAATAAAAATTETRSAELIAADEIREWGRNFDTPELATQYLRECQTADAAVAPTRDGFFAMVRAAQPPTVKGPTISAIEQAARNGQQAQLARSVSRVNLKAFKGEGAHEQAYRCGMHLAALLLRDEDAIRFCRENGISLSRAQTGTDNTKGGYTVLPEFEQTIFELIVQYGIARPNADVSLMTSETKLVTRRVGGLTAYPVGSGQRGTYSNTTDDQFELVARKWMVLAKYEDELGEDSYVDWADRLANESGIALAYSEDNATFNGDGTSTYHGIVGLIPKLLAATAGLATAAGATLASVTAANMTSLIGLLPQYARKSGNVKFYCSHGVWANVLERLAIAAGGNAYADIKGELTPVFFGRPVEIVEVMSATPATGEIAVLYGNMAQSTTFGDRRGITVKMTDSNDTDFESDLHAVKVTERFDVNNHDVGDTSVAGPMVALKLA
jgi:HK97 family phage major capsid protein